MDEKALLEHVGQGIVEVGSLGKAPQLLVISGVSGARRKKFGSTPNRASTRFPRLSVLPCRDAASRSSVGIANPALPALQNLKRWGALATARRGLLEALAPVVS